MVVMASKLIKTEDLAQESTRRLKKAQEEADAVLEHKPFHREVDEEEEMKLTSR